MLPKPRGSRLKRQDFEPFRTLDKNNNNTSKRGLHKEWDKKTRPTSRSESIWEVDTAAAAAVDLGVLGSVDYK